MLVLETAYVMPVTLYCQVVKKYDNVISHFDRAREGIKWTHRQTDGHNYGARSIVFVVH